MVEQLLETTAAEAIGYALVAFVWQGALAGALTALVLWRLGGVDPRWRYATACLALLVMTALPIRTAVAEYEMRIVTPAYAAPKVTAALPAAGAPLVAAGPSAQKPLVRQEPSETGFGIGTLVALWLAGVIALSLRLAGGWLLVRRLRARSTALGGDLPARVRTLANRLNVIPRVQARGSSMVDVPTVIGWTRPLVLVPASAISGLTRLELEAVLAHELAHIRRHDYGINMLQRVSETLLFYHPAVWWLSARIREEREMCADDLAVAACGDRILYASALENLERSRAPRALGVAANGGSLGGRIRRLLSPPSPRDRWSPVWTGILLVGLALGAALVTAPEDSRAAAPPPQTAPEIEVSPVPAPPPTTSEAARPVQVAPAPEPARPVEVAPAPERTVVAQLLPTPAPSPEPVVRYLGYGQVPQPATGTSWLGVTVEDGADQGALVLSVEPESPAAQGGIQAGDTITRYSDTGVVGARQFARLVEETPVGRTISLTLVRDGETLTLPVVSAARPLRTFGNIQIVSPELHVLRQSGDAAYWTAFGSPDLRLGLQVQEMTPQLRQFFGAAPDRGVLVVSVVEGSSAEEAGIRAGDVIVAVAGNPVEATRDLNWSGELDDDMLVLEIVRDGASRSFTLALDLPPRSLRIGP